MRKAVITAIVLCACVLAMISCNLDATIGIYSEVASSTPNRNVTLINYLGVNSAGNHFYQLDDGIYYTGRTSAVVKSTEKARVIGSCLQGDVLYVMKESFSEDTKATTVTISSIADPTAAEPVETMIPGGENLRLMLTNGIVLGSSKAYYLDGGTLEDYGLDEFELNYAYESENYALLSMTDKASSKQIIQVVCNDGLYGILPRAEDTRTFCGFQHFGTDDAFLLFYKDSSNKSYVMLFSDYGSEPVTTLAELKSSLAKADTYNASFCDYANSTVIVKCTNYFDKINILDLDNVTVTPQNNGFAADICTADIANIRKYKDNKFIVGTVSSLLYQIDMDDYSKNPVPID